MALARGVEGWGFGGGRSDCDWNREASVFVSVEVYMPAHELGCARLRCGVLIYIYIYIYIYACSRTRVCASALWCV